MTLKLSDTEDHTGADAGADTGVDTGAEVMADGQRMGLLAARDAAPILSRMGK
jgi:hypothetical protein